MNSSKALGVPGVIFALANEPAAAVAVSTVARFPKGHGVRFKIGG
jgi:hypothetical protein